MQICYKGEEYKKERDKDTDKDKKRRTRKITRDPISKTFEADTVHPLHCVPFTQITGMGFSSTSGVVNVRFACPKGFVETEGRVLSDTEVSFLTPNFEKFGPMQVRQAR